MFLHRAKDNHGQLNPNYVGNFMKTLVPEL